MPLIILLMLAGFAAMVAAEPWQICGTTKYTANHQVHGQQHVPIQPQPAILLHIGTDPSRLFDKTFKGDAPNKVYGVALCRGDMDPYACSTCVGTAFQGARQRCPLTKDATIFYDNRLNTSMFVDGALVLMNMSSEPMLPACWDTTHNHAQATNFTQFFRSVLTDIVGHVLSTTAHYAAIRVDKDDGISTSAVVPRLYCLAQCAPDLVEDICYYCLTNFSDLATANFAGRRGGRVLGVRCNLRYDSDKFFAGEPTWSSGSAAPGPAPQPAPLPPSPERRKPISKGLVIGLVVPLLALLICIIVAFRLRRHMKGKMMNEHEDEALIWGLEGRSSEFKIYDISQIIEATGNFSEENKLGQGGFGPVYKGRFPDGLEIAVKRLASHSNQGVTQFRNEIQLIAKLQHTNLVRLYGCCYQGQEKLLIYEYLPNKSLDFFIFDETRRALIDWNKSLAIIDGIAQGLLYLHKLSRLRVIHRDLKAGNILLDWEMKPKISDFGLAKIFNTNDNEGNTKSPAGTYGYMAPEYASEGLYSIKSDVFSFGVLTLEIVSGKRTSSFHRYGDFISISIYAWQMWKDERWIEFLDTTFDTESHKLQMMRCVNIGLLCALLENGLLVPVP
ncbi:hypothetical protein PVAP13_8NG285100, partial [Panicum virgatum]